MQLFQSNQYPGVKKASTPSSLPFCVDLLLPKGYSLTETGSHCSCPCLPPCCPFLAAARSPCHIAQSVPRSTPHFHTIRLLQNQIRFSCWRSKESRNPRRTAPPPALCPVLAVHRLVRAWNLCPGPVREPLSPATQPNGVKCPCLLIRPPPYQPLAQLPDRRRMKQGDRESRLHCPTSTSPEEDIGFLA
ncbi:uncharacterized protein LY79DRAFT_538255 [Colletotrichum navitas]|uniref:Uncharacterized protein n=1 Tax=Colletotrichum navitas TaxID=681940 RepID=A0AAD8QB98_9PEZI|nr:uncharacterized protein LY79DRAFT_538255 [Colletotrichum navitas]KAK1598796.1 hypothetical protein LY79DRAFT_538255 [Colletotrichum navitas]